MRIRVLKPSAGIFEGVSLSHMFPGVSYEVSESLGDFLVTTGIAEYLGSSKRVVPTIDNDPDSHIFGGVTVIPDPDREPSDS